MEQYEDISLLNVEVTSKEHGVGTVIKQKMNRITVRFESREIEFMIHKKYSMRPSFENDNEIVEAFTAYSDLRDRLSALQRELKRIQTAANK